MAEEELVDVKFRLYDGSDIGPFRYAVASTVEMLKQRIMLDWPKGKEVAPKAVNEVKLISSGKVLDNNRTVGDCRIPTLGGDVAGGAAIIMHVVVQQELPKTKTEKKMGKTPSRIACSCSIL
ncbi:Membrane-anchored ubiquitin-fold protein 3 [Linum grandiflorum]